ncbi:MAG: hypothetical protein WC533_00665 [Candidatus Pacearchaeota archaeon]
MEYNRDSTIIIAMAYGDLIKEFTLFQEMQKRKTFVHTEEEHAGVDILIEEAKESLRLTAEHYKKVVPLNIRTGLTPPELEIFLTTL